MVPSGDLNTYLLAKLHVSMQPAAPVPECIEAATEEQADRGGQAGGGLDAARWSLVCNLLRDLLGRWHDLANTVAGGMRDLGLYEASEVVLANVPESLQVRSTGTTVRGGGLPRVPDRPLTDNDLEAIARIINEELSGFPNARQAIRTRLAVIEADIAPRESPHV
jgi:hypothetical protein